CIRDGIGGTMSYFDYW
nr:immunoglobulin heavy chain junction region [Macaca mulatta]MOY21705.1 immunoglobulin heavy chain junction region [Macaca mulatta]MOY22655.1 immunoglobulin heavy chain junction region [Macaca mulatta]MOY22689.1 immunoglobulin heavy chain junction region [Macaca mulatta]MOY23070.1 immunoglobulin heavy chain junction region [Macaca mulatta]